MGSRTTDAKDIPHVDPGTDRRRRPRAEPKGVLVLIGGACTPHGHALRSFLDLTGARSGGRIIGVTTGSAHPPGAARGWRAALRSVGAFHVSVPAFWRGGPTLMPPRRSPPRWPSTSSAELASATTVSSRTPDAGDIPHVDPGTRRHRRPRPEPKGVLVLIGGACTPHGHALRTFLDLAGARSGGRIVGLTTASADPEEAARSWLATLRSVGAFNVEIPQFDRGDETLDAPIARMIRDAAGVLLGGGDQVKLVAGLSGTRTCAAMRDLYEAGGAICGTSAGAAALTELTMAGGEVDEEGNLVEQYIGPGLGFLGYDAIIDTHFSQRRRLQRLFLVVASNRQLLGVGIDEDTALVVRGHRGEVVGAGGVTFVDGRDTVRFDNAGDLQKGRQLTLSHLRVGIVGTRYHLNLRERELDELVTGEASPHRVSALPRTGA